MSSAALSVFERIAHQVETVRGSATRELDSGNLEAGTALLRSCIVFTLAALDAYMHEQAVRLLAQQALTNTVAATTVASYLGSVTVDDVTGKSLATPESYIRYRLSYKTLASPANIDSMLTTAGLNATDIWLHTALALASRPDRLRNQLTLLYDRRNQIAHEGDWDIIDLSFRRVEPAHADDCFACIRGLVLQMEVHLP